MNIAIIPARGGSKRIPRKNIREFCGRPMLAWPIEAAQKSSLFQRIIVSTEDEEIAQIARGCGAEVPFMRPRELADDYTGTNPIVRHCLEWLIEHDQRPDYACCIYATAPFLQPEYLKQGLEIVKKTKCSFAFSVTSYPSPIQRSLKIRPDGHAEPFFPENVSQRSQDLEEAYHDAGQFYWGAPESFINYLNVHTAYPMPVVLPRYLVQDIDNLDDWKRAELMYKALLSTAERPR